MSVIVNVEAQKSHHPGYDIRTRAVFYVARLISSQLGREFWHSDYGSLKKVYSIWICMGAPSKVGNAIASIRMQQEDLYGHLPDAPEAYDKAEIVVVALDGTVPAEDDFLGMMNTVLSHDVPRDEKLRQLEDRYNMRITDDVAEGVNIMCNLGEGIAEKYWEQGIEQGIEQGLEQGIEQGIEQGRLQAILEVIKSGMPYGDVARIFGLSLSEVEAIERGALASA